MPPKVRITKEDIVKTALELVRSGSAHALNARAIASAMNCSTQPVFSNFATLDQLAAEVKNAAYDHYLSFIKEEVESGEYPQYKAFGMAYVRFAKEEKELFKFLFMCDRTGSDFPSPPDFEKSVQIIMESNGITKEEATLMHLEMWSCVHGIGSMIVTSFLTLDDDIISRMLSDIYQGLRAKYKQTEEQNERN